MSLILVSETILEDTQFFWFCFMWVHKKIQPSLSEIRQRSFLLGCKPNRSLVHIFQFFSQLYGRHYLKSNVCKVEAHFTMLYLINKKILFVSGWFTFLCFCFKKNKSETICTKRNSILQIQMFVWSFFS